MSNYYIVNKFEIEWIRQALHYISPISITTRFFELFINKLEIFLNIFSDTFVNIY